MTDRDIMQQALEVMGTVGADHICEASHHAKKDRHKLGEPCPLQQRWHIAYQALFERLAQPEQEPVAWRAVREDGTPTTDWIDGDGRQQIPNAPASSIQIAYTAPQPRQWLSTSDLDEIDTHIRERGHATIAEIYQAIEAALWEKNT